MIYDLSKAPEIDKLKTRLNHLYKKGAKVDLTEKRKQRTHKQNKYFYLLLSLYASETGYTIDEAKHLLKTQICKDFFEYKKKGVKFYKSTADFDTLEKTLIIEKFRNHSSNDLGIYLPEPHEEEKLRSIQDQMKSYGVRQYL